MLLQKLVEYAGRLPGLPPPLYAERPIRYIVALDQRGEPLSQDLIDTADMKDRRAKRGAPRLAPQIQRTVAIKPLLMADRADYTFGQPRGEEDGAKERAEGRHAKYMDVLKRCALETEEPEVQSVLRFLQDDPLDQLTLPEDFDEAAAFTFRVNGSFPIDLPAVRTFWAREHSLGDADGALSECLVCGRQGPVLDRLPSKIKGVPGGQTSGTALISANEDAFESYGLRASGVAPTCESCGERFTKGINRLLATEANNFRIAGSAFVFWTREESDFSFRSFMHEPDSEEVRALIESVRSGKPAAGPDEVAFYATSLTGSGGRAVVRDWIDTTVGEVKRSLARWFQLQRIVGWDGKVQTPIGPVPARRSYGP